MTCKNQTSPIDININSINGKCDLKCKYSFKYQDNVSTVITNRVDYLMLSYQNGSTPAVNFNNYTYNVKEIRLYTPSLHSYNGFKVDAELVIVHNPITGTKPLLVCIPVKEGESGSIGSIHLKTIVNNASTTQGKSVTVNLSKFDLDSYVPKKPFFSYSGTNPYLPCGGSNDFIVYEPLNSDIYLSKASLQKLKGIIKENAYIISKNNSLFYNETGPLMDDGSDNIYIDCQPVGQSEEEVLVVDTDKSTYSPPSIENILNNPYVQIILGSLLFIALILIANIVFGFASKTSKVTNITMKGGRKLTMNI